MKADYLKRSVPALIHTIHNRLSGATSIIYRKHFGIGLTERLVLFHLSVENDINVKRLAEAVGTDKSTISRAIAKLVSLDLVEAHDNPRDNRMRVVGITRKGRVFLKRITAFAQKRSEYLVSIFDDGEKEQILNLLQRLLAHVPTASQYVPEEEDY